MHETKNAAPPKKEKLSYRRLEKSHIKKPLPYLESGFLKTFFGEKNYSPCPKISG